MRIGWIGLGRIGLPMAARLVAAGHEVNGHDIDPRRMALAAERGIRKTSSLETAEVVFTSLPSEAALLEVVRNLKGHAVLVETSTIGPRASASIAETFGPYLRAPISGSTATAEAGALTTFVSGPRAAFEQVRPALQAYSRAQIWLGEAEEARYAKLAVNVMVAVTAGMLGEALALARKGGIGWDAVLELVGESVVASPLIKYKLEPLRRRDFTAAATNALVLKDLELASQAAAQAGIELPLAAHMRELYARLVDGGAADEDFFSVVKLLERPGGQAP